MKPITWTCHICGEERPDDLIGVASAKTPCKTVTVNVRYCKDRASCIKGAIEKAKTDIQVFNLSMNEPSVYEKP